MCTVDQQESSRPHSLPLARDDSLKKRDSILTSYFHKNLRQKTKNVKRLENKNNESTFFSFICFIFINLSSHIKIFDRNLFSFRVNHILSPINLLRKFNNFLSSLSSSIATKLQQCERMVQFFS